MVLDTVKTFKGCPAVSFVTLNSIKALCEVRIEASKKLILASTKRPTTFHQSIRFQFISPQAPSTMEKA